MNRRMESSRAKPRRTGDQGTDRSRVLGKKTFAAIAAVEGLSLKTASRKRLDELNASKLSPEEKRAEVLRAYVAPKRRK
ncbi:MAG TPA: hypothetical protein VGL66_15110 [Caulobacteraceae bacterium]|jgi:hypothetical protein